MRSIQYLFSSQNVSVGGGFGIGGWRYKQSLWETHAVVSQGLTSFLNWQTLVTFLMVFPGLTNSLDCTDCVGGMACDQSGLTYPLRPCAPGYYCRSGAMTTTPTQGEFEACEMQRLKFEKIKCVYGRKTLLENEPEVDKLGNGSVHWWREIEEEDNCRWKIFCDHNLASRKDFAGNF